MHKLTQEELGMIEARIDEIDRTLDLCTKYDWDVVQNLETELNVLMTRVESSMQNIQRKKLRHLRLVA